MTIQQIQTIISGTNTQFNALPSSGRGMLIMPISGFKTLVNANDKDGSLFLIQNTSNPPSSGLTEEEFSAFVANIVALFPA